MAAVLTDPWGTSISLTEGLRAVALAARPEVVHARPTSVVRPERGMRGRVDRV